MKKYKLLLKFEDEIFYVSVPAFHNDKYVSFGETKEEAVEAAKELLALEIATCYDENKDIPEDKEVVTLEDNEELLEVEVNPDEENAKVERVNRICRLIIK